MSTLPHKFGTAEISSPELKKIAMQCMENFLALARQMSEVQQGLNGITRSLKGNSLEIIAVDKSARSALAYKADLVDGKVPASELPSYVDDVLEFDYESFPSSGIAAFSDAVAYAVGDRVTYGSPAKIYIFTAAHAAGAWTGEDVRLATEFPAAGEGGKIYVDISTGKVYRWSGSIYVEISPAPDLSGYVLKTTEVNGKPLSGNIDIGAADIAVDSSTTVAQSLSAKRDKGDLVVYDSQGQATADTLAKASDVPSVGAFVKYGNIPKIRAYTSQTTYYVGDIVEHSSNYYTCKTQHTTAAGNPGWTANNWLQIVAFSSNTTYFAGAVAIYGNLWYRRKTAGKSSWNASDWEELTFVDAAFANSVHLANPDPLGGETVSFVVRMRDLVPNTTRQYCVDFHWNKIVSGSLSGTKISTTGLSSNISSSDDSGTETRTGVSGTTDITVSLARYMECMVKVYIRNS